jgi:hypothetical protein
MSMLDLLKKGFGYVLMSMGVSSPNRKPAPRTKVAAETATETKKTV